ncbi:MAG: class I SAM-dependent methyltransferase [Anaerolineales bacterium]
MRKIDIKEKIAELGIEHPSWETFMHLGNLLKLRQGSDGDFQHANYESGLLLYGLVRHYRPQAILEIGTGRGYGAFCMAMALRDANLPGKIMTLDIKGYDEPQTWALDAGQGPSIAARSLREVWETYLETDLRARVEHRQGTSIESMAALLASREFEPDFIYVDGDHTATGTRHDILASMLLARRPFRMLLDDYHLQSDYLFGLRRLIDTMLAPVFDLEAIFADRRWYGETFENIPLAKAPYAQVLLDSEKTLRPMDERFSREKLAAKLKEQRRIWRLNLLLDEFGYAYRRRFRRIEKLP